MNLKRAAAACRRSAIPFTFNTYGELLLRGVRVETFVSRFRAGESIESIAQDYNITYAEIIEAIRCGAR